MRFALAWDWGPWGSPINLRGTAGRCFSGTSEVRRPSVPLVSEFGSCVPHGTNARDGDALHSPRSSEVRQCQWRVQPISILIFPLSLIDTTRPACDCGHPVTHTLWMLILSSAQIRSFRVVSLQRLTIQFETIPI